MKVDVNGWTKLVAEYLWYLVPLLKGEALIAIMAVGAFLIGENGDI